jgi:hypothetical protein
MIFHVIHFNHANLKIEKRKKSSPVFCRQSVRSQNFNRKERNDIRKERKVNIFFVLGIYIGQCCASLMASSRRRYMQRPQHRTAGVSQLLTLNF